MTISAKIIADSINPRNGVRITTYELEYPRFVHAEFMTHRLFSRNAASSRAIPVKRAIELIKENTARPKHWGKNQPGMSAKEECNDDRMGGDNEFHGYNRDEWWNDARDMAILHAEEFDKCGYHKQIVNRLLEPFSHIKVVCTATDFENFFWLRNHPDAQPEIQELAVKMLEARAASKPVKLKHGEWHVPYYNDGFWIPEALLHGDLDSHGHTYKEALMISASCCAQVSYRRNDDSLEKAAAVFQRLIESKPCHASPMEHQATPHFRTIDTPVAEVQKGITHWAYPKTGNPYSLEAWSGNFREWIQHRQLIPDNACWEYNYAP